MQTLEHIDQIKQITYFLLYVSSNPVNRICEILMSCVFPIFLVYDFGKYQGRF